MLKGMLTGVLLTGAVLAACGDGSERGLRHLVDEVQSVRAAAEQGDVVEARQQLDDLRVTAGVLRGRGRITAAELVSFREALDRVDTELVATERSFLAASTAAQPTSVAPTTVAPTTVAPTTTTTVAPPTTEPPEWPGKRKGQEEDDN